MSQILTGDLSLGNTSFTPASNWHVSFQSAGGGLVGVSSTNGAIVTASVSARLTTPSTPDPGPVVVSSRWEITGTSGPFPDLNIINGEMNIYHPPGIKINELSGGITVRTVGNGGPVSGTITKTSDVNTLCAIYSLTPSDMFANLTAEFVIGFSIVAPGTVTGQIGGVSGGAQTTCLSFSVPDSSSADIEITGDGGVLVSSEADIESSGFPDIHVTGSGGVLVGSIGSGSTPLVLSKDVSGMYTFISDKRNDTIYTKNSDPDDTTDVAIPEPFGKTGYFGF